MKVGIGIGRCKGHSLKEKGEVHSRHAVSPPRSALGRALKKLWMYKSLFTIDHI